MPLPLSLAPTLRARAGTRAGARTRASIIPNKKKFFFPTNQLFFLLFTTFYTSVLVASMLGLFIMGGF